MASAIWRVGETATHLVPVLLRVVLLHRLFSQSDRVLQHVVGHIGGPHHFGLGSALLTPLM